MAAIYGVSEWGLAALAGLAIVVVAIIAEIVRRRKPRLDPDAGLCESLGQYPPAPAPGTHHLTFEGQPVRLRLVVLAPAGKAIEINANMAEGLLQAIFHGLGQVADLDQPRIRIWPAQLSQEGFGPKFFSNTKRPEPPDSPSRWIFAAGRAQAGRKVVLLGVALETAEPTMRGNVRMDVEKWTEKLRVVVTG